MAPSNSSNFIKKYGTNGKSELFNKKTKWVVTNSDTQLVSIVKKYADLESKYTLNTMSKLSANYDSIANGDKTASQVAGKTVNVTVEDIRKYREYSEFKSSTFTSKENPKYDEGQVVELSFEFVK